MNTGLSVHGIYKIKIIPQRVVPIKVFIHNIADTGSCRYRQTMKPKACSLYLVCTLQSLCVMDGYTKTAKVKSLNTHLYHVFNTAHTWSSSSWQVNMHLSIHLSWTLSILVLIWNIILHTANWTSAQKGDKKESINVAWCNHSNDIEIRASRSTQKSDWDSDTKSDG